VERAIDSLHLTIRDIRNFIFGLRPELLSGMTLMGGLAATAEEFRHNSMIDVELQENGLTEEPTVDTTAHLLGIVHEALGNIARHSGASRAVITVATTNDGLELTVTDNGRGFDPATAATIGHQGLVNMRERAEGIGARMTIDSDSAGTTVRVLLPSAATTDLPGRPPS
jgi:two-component system, NarL family, sensor histidine kinase DevS